MANTEIDNPELLERARKALYRIASVMSRHHPDSREWSGGELETKGYLRALQDNGLISPGAFEQLRSDQATVLSVPTLTDADLENNPTYRALKGLLLGESAR